MRQNTPSKKCKKKGLSYYLVRQPLFFFFFGNYSNKGTGGPGKTGPCWRDPTKDKGFAGNKAPTGASASRENPDRVGVALRRTKALRGTRRQQGRRQAEKIRTVLAWPDEGIRACGEQGANKGAGGPGKSGPCWRDPTKDKGFAENKAPTRAPMAGRIRAMLAWHDGGKRLCGEVDANFTKVYNKTIVTEATTG